MAGRAGRVGLMLALTALTVTACHKKAPPEDGAASSRGLQVEAYDPVAPKAPLKGKLETLARHPEDIRAPLPQVSSEPPAAESSQAAPDKG